MNKNVTLLMVLLTIFSIVAVPVFLTTGNAVACVSTRSNGVTFKKSFISIRNSPDLYMVGRQQIRRLRYQLVILNGLVPGVNRKFGSQKCAEDRQRAFLGRGRPGSVAFGRG